VIRPDIPTPFGTNTRRKFEVRFSGSGLAASSEAARELGEKVHRDPGDRSRRVSLLAAGAARTDLRTDLQ
jgi:hypothetical protein